MATILADNIVYNEISSYIPDVMTALQNTEASEKITLKNIRDAFRRRQVQSKQWLLDNIKSSIIDKNSKILVIGGWLGFTSWFLFRSGYKNITEIDCDSDMHIFASYLNRENSNYKHHIADANNWDYSLYDAIINTSCEHIADNSWYANIPLGKKVVLQSTDLLWIDHYNLVYSEADMINKYACTHYVTCSTLNCGTWNRYLLIGTK